MQFLRTLNSYIIPGHRIGVIGPRFFPRSYTQHPGITSETPLIVKEGPSSYKAGCPKCSQYEIEHHHVEDADGRDYAVSAREVSRFLKACEYTPNKSAVEGGVR